MGDSAVLPMFLKPPTNKELIVKFIEINGTKILCEKEVKLLGNAIFKKNIYIKKKYKPTI